MQTEDSEKEKTGAVIIDTDPGCVSPPFYAIWEERESALRSRNAILFCYVAETRTRGVLYI